MTVDIHVEGAPSTALAVAADLDAAAAALHARLRRARKAGLREAD